MRSRSFWRCIGLCSCRPLFLELLRAMSTRSAISRYSRARSAGSGAAQIDNHGDRIGAGAKNVCGGCHGDAANGDKRLSGQSARALRNKFDADDGIGIFFRAVGKMGPTAI